MSLREEIRPYVDGNGLVNCSLNHGDGKRGSDNGVCFTSEYYDLLADNGESTRFDVEEFRQTINRCSVLPGLVARAPGEKQGGPPPDDLYAIAAASRTLGCADVAEAIVKYGESTNWVFNADNPGNPHQYGNNDYEGWLGRQPALICALKSAANRELPGWLKIVTAIVIATSNMYDELGNTNVRRIAYALVKSVEGQKGILAWASKVWWNRLRRDYGDEGMRAVAKIYYQDNHPFMRYWKNKWEMK